MSAEYEHDSREIPPPPPFRYQELRTPSPPPYGHDGITDRGNESVLPRSQSMPASENAQTIQKLLGQDVETYVNTHIGAYEDAKKRWTECSYEEWKSGAEGEVFCPMVGMDQRMLRLCGAAEIAGKFGNLIDFVSGS